MLNFKNSVKAKLSHLLKTFGEKNHTPKKISLKAVAMSLVAFSVFCAGFAANYRIGYTVKVENIVIGTVATKGEYYEILDEVKTEVESTTEIVFPETEESFSVELVAIDNFSKKEEIAENVKALAEAETAVAASIHTEEVVIEEVPEDGGTGEFIMPTSGNLSSPFGKRWGKNHNGIDLAAAKGTPIYASDTGVVIVSEYQNNGYGNIVKIDHQNGFVTFYAHCSKLHVKSGDIVKSGDLIAEVGSTGRSTGNHLHFEIRENDIPKNPFNYLK